MKPLRTLLVALSLLVSVSVTGTALAGEAQDLVQARRAEVARLMNEKGSAERDKKVAGILGGLFDYEAMARRSLGKHWDDLSEAQRAEFTGVLKQLIQRNIEKNVRATMKYEVQFLGEEEKEGNTRVKTKAVSAEKKSEEPVTIDYVMAHTDAGWRSVDVITEGSSMVGSYRSQFNKIISKDGYDALIKKMKSRLTER